MSEVKGHSRARNMIGGRSHELCQLLSSIKPGTFPDFPHWEKQPIACVSLVASDGDTCTDLVLRNGADLGLTRPLNEQNGSHGK